ncbi:hypothetical protein [Puia dinghuensis]|uniref:DUF1080 domain-containing protein n=1 Tax=Puia dinghuensis TaxID=1792502 RepID=A0A8J2XWF2_9BACT|nr:hypothetical protein [Puia dinghuensis]GGB19451.1 hypothetical protein GCM10011511_48970 [Puia dinghuensis]
MRKIFSYAATAVLVATTTFSVQAQNAVDQVNNSVDKTTNTVNKIGGLFKKKKKNTDSTAAKPAASPNTNITINSGYDFVPGATVLFFDPFDSTVMGNFPAKWVTDASGEVVTLQQYPGKWFNITANGMYIPKLKGGLPKDFTVEFDLILANVSGNHTFYVDFEDALNHNFDRYPSNPFLQFRIYDHGNAYVDCKGKNLSTDVKSSAYNEGGKINHFAIRKQGERLLIYINQEKTFDINHAFEDQRTYSTFKFSADFTNPSHFLVSNVKIAAL